MKTPLSKRHSTQLASSFWSVFSLLFLLGLASLHAGPDETAQQIDRIINRAYRATNAKPAPLTNDATFLRRVYFDLTGTLPTLQETRTFLSNKSSDKRSALVERLLSSENHVDYWTLKWCDLLRVKSEYPINLWPNGVQAYHRFIRQSIATNKPYDLFAHELLTSSGSNYRVPAVNFYRAVQEPTAHSISAATALTFLGTRIENWDTEKQNQFAEFFSKVAFKRTAEWKEEIVYFDTRSPEEVKTRFPDGTAITIEAHTDPRQIFADWLIDDTNPFFARVAVNRIWYWLMGSGIVSPADDFGPHNPAQNSQLLAQLEQAFILSGYDQRALIASIVSSKTYQRSIPKKPQLSYAEYNLRPLEAEVLVDALNQLTNSSERYSSPIPEPFTFIPEANRSIALADGSITSQFLETFGRPSRDTGRLDERNQIPNDAQRLSLLNSSEIQGQISNSPLFRQIGKPLRKNPSKVVQATYLAVLSRYPNKAELDTALRYINQAGKQSRHAALDVAWALINSKEFLYKH
ncbi:DUF1553 domain-containing protein [Pelagicoccus mobilis]|uniref:DUF1553 domain-containing protein n=1 Tax=Pelagicoccus mobilis TaxID=415221 RepID=A0A934RRG8_9BACT|nr:DUF1553 domain-containing protein [Pelagicoccus mobilis]MBK1876205.1 DUF1553 domain-containing protein [Pelagicoccus mobilis]